MLKKFYIKKEFFVSSKVSDIKDQYQIQEIIGRGAFATVYRAQMKCYPYTTRAVKRIKKKFVRNPDSILREYLALTSLDHPGINKIYETFEDPDNYFMVLDHCEGGELFHRLTRAGGFSERDARGLFCQMLGIVKYCHDNRVAHRDLKPENFLFVERDRPELMLIDFGLCFRWRRAMADELQTRQGQITGTAYYMAPEIFSGRYDQRCDIWSLGIILFMLATGEPPVAGSSSEEVLRNIKAGALNLSILEQRGLSSEVVDLVRRILRPEDDRISLEEVMEHPWMSMQLPEATLNINFGKIRQYSQFSKFKVLVLNFIASQLPQKEIMSLSKVFLQIDGDKSGSLSVAELEDYFKRHRREEYGDMREIIECLDVDHNGQVAYNEFVSGCLSRSIANNREYLMYAFKSFDVNGDGKLSREELAVVLKSYKREFSENEKLVDQLLRECDSNRDSFIDFEEFCQYLIDKNKESLRAEAAQAGAHLPE